MDYFTTSVLPRLESIVDGTDKDGITEKVKWDKGGSFITFELKTNNISFISQYTEPSLKLKKFDFAICDIEKIVRLIEFDGDHFFSEGAWCEKSNFQSMSGRPGKIPSP